VQKQELQAQRELQEPVLPQQVRGRPVQQEQLRRKNHQ